MKSSFPGLPPPGSPLMGPTSRLHDKPFLSVEQAIAHANERQRLTDAAASANRAHEIATRNRQIEELERLKAGT